MRQRNVRTILVAAVAAGALLSTSLALGDSLTLRNGTVLTGIVKQMDGGYDITLEDGKHRFVPTEDVKSVQLSNVGKVTEENARERLLSLQRSVESERDLDRIIERYEQFIPMNANTAAAKLAEADLAAWRDRKSQDMVKVGARWLTRAERDEALVASAKIVEEINQTIDAGDVLAASDRLRRVLREDPENVSYLYLNGVLQMQREQFGEAKRSFDGVAKQIDGHPPTLINLAVLAVQNRRWPQAVTLIDQALSIAPTSQEILDGIIELQHLVPEATQRSQLFEKLMKRAGPLESALQERQAQQGLFRLGSKWVDKAALDKAKADLDAFEAKKAELEKDYQSTQEAIRRNDEQIQMLERMLDRIEADSLIRDTQGNVVRRRYPESYWDIQRDLDRVKDQQRAATNHVTDLRKQAEVVKANQPKPPLDGKLTPIDQRGVPVLLPANATTQPVVVRDVEPIPEPSTQPATQSAPGGTTEPPAPPVGPLLPGLPTTAPAGRGLFEG